ncbi:MAG TPA: NHL repeat-containing protein [Acidimicrobiales bacterium]|nr:NHL repeat-containing protein [Acidimicrobiales bacterium]
MPAPAAAGAAPVPGGLVFVVNYGGMGSSGIAANGSVMSYRLDGSGNLHPWQTISKGLSAPQGLTFDHAGDLWVSSSNTNTLVEYKRAELAGHSPLPSVTISPDSNGSLNGPGGLAFDSAGDLWVANTGVTTVVEYSAAQLAKSGSPTPEVTISNSNFTTPYGVALDSSGNLWVSDNDQPTSPGVWEYPKSQLAKASPAPAVTLNLPVSPLGDDTRSGLAFDSAGNLWVVNSGGGALVEFAKSQLAKRTSTPHVTITAGTSNSLNAPDGMSIDSSGDVWVANTGSSTIVEFAKSELSKSGSPKPIRTIAGTSTGLNFPMDVEVAPAGS